MSTKITRAVELDAEDLTDLRSSILTEIFSHQVIVRHAIEEHPITLKDEIKFHENKVIKLINLRTKFNDLHSQITKEEQLCM